MLVVSLSRACYQLTVVVILWISLFPVLRRERRPAAASIGPFRAVLRRTAFQRVRHGPGAERYRLGARQEHQQRWLPVAPGRFACVAVPLVLRQAISGVFA
jgi:hypothetical protein